MIGSRRLVPTARLASMRPRLRIAASSTVLVAAVVSGCQSNAHAVPQPLRDNFDGPDGLITSSRHPEVTSPLWRLTSGSLFRDRQEGWSGPINDETESAVFRMVSREADFTDLDMRLRLRLDDFATTTRTPAQDYDGAHIWVRYRSEFELYAISVDRRDGTMIVKKKCPGGPINGGSYYDLGPSQHGAPVPLGDWQQIQVSVRDLPDGSVLINARRDDRMLAVVDHGIGCAALRGPGAVGIRGDNAELRLDDMVVQPQQSG